MTAVLEQRELFTMPAREQGRGRLFVTTIGEFRGYCRQTVVVDRVAGECGLATTDAAELAEHMRAVHGVKGPDVPKPLKPFPRPRAPKVEDLVFEPKAWAPGATVEFDTKAGRRTGQVWSDAPPPASVWVVDAETGAAWCVKKDGYAIDMVWRGRA